ESIDRRRCWRRGKSSSASRHVSFGRMPRLQAMKYGMMFSLVAMVFAAVMGCSGDGIGSAGQGCTEIGCGPSFQVEFSRASWPAGKVDVVVVADGTTT